MSSRAVLAYVRTALDRPMASHHLVVVSAGLLISLGLMMVLSASSYYALGSAGGGDAYYFVKRQAIFAAAGLPLAWLVSRFKASVLALMAWVALFGAMMLLTLTYVPGLGAEVNGNRNWLRLGSDILTIQPSEFAKIAIVLWGAQVLARKEKLLDQPRHLAIPYLPLAGLLVLLVVFQGDLGTAMVMAAIMLGVLWLIGAPKRIFLVLIGGAAASIAVMVKTNPNRMRRLVGFLNPDEGRLDINMQPSVGIEAVASGGWWGLGIGGGRQKWGSLAEAHTDYIFAVIAEELGLFGSLIVLGLFLVLGYAGLRIARRNDQTFYKYLACGVTSWFMVQALVNLAVVLRLGPVMGVPLPLVSYGGSAMIANLIALGLLLAAARAEPDARAYLAGRANNKAKPRLTTVVAGQRGRES